MTTKTRPVPAPPLPARPPKPSSYFPSAQPQAPRSAPAEAPAEAEVPPSVAVEQPTKAPQGFTIRRAPAAAAAAEKENLARNGPFSGTSAKAGNEARALLWHEGAEGNAVEKKKWLERSRALRARLAGGP